MAVLSNTGIRAGASAAASGGDAYQIEKSLRFNDPDTGHLSHTFVNANRKKFTWSGWVKRHKLGTRQNFLSPYSSNGEYTLYFCFDSSDTDSIQIGNYGTSWDFELITKQVFRDTASWYHIVLAVDTTQATNYERVKLWVNGAQQKFKNTDYPDQDLDTYMNKAGQHDIGQLKASNVYADYSLSEVHYLSGVAIGAGAFGSYDGKGLSLIHI